ncbi:hypothetical protein PKF05_03515 [Fusobacterium simiae]|uniref:hypothetical protein n=1 Tax=Fusobacterium simiae TaxID=855 RepID=UPI0020C36DD9|nr:hypothetical protein [Fusobacterium simiae]MDC7954904.1 hypothetical protein [Fusobacterium simiae]
MKEKELKISPVQESSSFSKIYAHFILFTPFIPIIVLGIICHYNKEVIKTLCQAFLEQKVFLIIFVILWLWGMINMSREVLNYLLTEEVCYIENKVFYYQKFRRIFGTRKLMKKLEISLSEILEVKEVKKPSILYYFLNPIGHRNSVEIETRDGKKYKIMNSVSFENKKSQNPTSEITDERARKIYNEVKNMISK